MAIRIRKTTDGVVALCAAKSEPIEGDIYLDDDIHHALTIKFENDFRSMGFLRSDFDMMNIDPSELEVVFTDMGDDYPPRDVKEFAVMPSGDIVIMTVDDGRGNESLWFNKNWKHPKSKLRRKKINNQGSKQKKRFVQHALIAGK